MAFRGAFVVPALYQNRPASGRTPRFDIAPPVANHHRGAEIDIPVARGVSEHARLRFAAGAGVGVGVIADADVIDRERCAQVGVDRFHRRLRLPAGADVGLIGDHNDAETRLLQRVHCIGHARQELELGHAPGRIGLAIPDRRAIDHSVAIEKHGPVHVCAGLTFASGVGAAMPATDSHFARCTASAGCDTSACQTTAWNASASGVTSSASIVGTTITSSPGRLATRFVYPPSRPTMPKIFVPRRRASSKARTMFGLTFFAASPPPTENMSSASFSPARLPLSHSANTVSHPSSLVRAVSSDTL